jgi:tetratricopeptide (TPR) repeat protein
VTSPETEREALIRAQEAFDTGRYRLAAGLWRALQVTGRQVVDEAVLHRAEILQAAQVKLRRRDYPGAARDLAEGAEWADDYRGALAAVARASESLDRGEPDEAALQAAESHAFTNAEALVIRGLMHIRAGETERARSDLERALELDPEHTRALTNLGNLELEEGDPARAGERFRAAIKIDPDYSLPHHNLAVALRRQRKLGESIRHIKRAQQLDYRKHNVRPPRAGGGPDTARAGPAWRSWLWIAAGAALIYFLFFR